MTNTNRFGKAIIKLTIIAGVLLSLIQLFYNRSLSVDESFLALNIINRSHFDLLKPLDFVQVAPILFLQIEKIFSGLIPNSEYGLRLFPFISYLLSLFLFFKILKIIHQNSYTIIFSLSLFVFNATLIYYSSEVKQYMTDVFVILSVYYFLLKEYKIETHKYYILGIVGVISIFLSNVAPIILSAAGLYLLFDIVRNKKKNFLHLAFVSIVWASSFLLYYILFIYDHPSRNPMLTFWVNSGAFMPVNPLSAEFYNFLFAKTAMIVHALFQFGSYGGICLFILILIGIVSLIRKKRINIIILTLTPILLHLLLSVFKIYPFDTRLILYTCPCIIIICSFGFNYSVNVIFADLKIERFRLLAISIPLLMSYYFYTTGFPQQHEEIKKGITFIEQHMFSNDKVYVNHDASFPFRYYKETHFIKMDTNNVCYGSNYMSFSANGKWECDTIKYSNDLSSLSGRVWLLFNLGTYPQYALNYFDAKGKKLLQEFHVKGSDVYLFDIGN